ncbi:hypothetical protein HMPREF1580_00990 [Gardnerella vaginalis JCP8070]|nr:hypothetical protein HMPREF1582_00009 [Gardnerella vaginalis JCP8151A]EPI59062.1 hypothetical protein HMPREF1580_00990 [Gardnerella vaginalis JCP8070]
MYYGTCNNLDKSSNNSIFQFFWQLVLLRIILSMYANFSLRLVI